MSYGDNCKPTGLSKPDEDHIAISWADGAESVIPMNFLRAKCPCASCINEWTGEVMIKAEDVEHVRVASMNQMGTYAFSIAFSDGHSTGIFTYKRLRGWGDELVSNPSVNPYHAESQ